MEYSANQNIPEPELSFHMKFKKCRVHLLYHGIIQGHKHYEMSSYFRDLIISQRENQKN